MDGSAFSQPDGFYMIMLKSTILRSYFRYRLSLTLAFNLWRSIMDPVVKRQMQIDKMRLRRHTRFHQNRELNFPIRLMG